MERMNALDAGLYFAEEERAPLHIASVTVLEGPPPAYSELVDTIRRRMPRVPRYRQRVRTVPLNIDLPGWEDDPEFRLDRHLRHTTVPSPGGRQELSVLVGRIMTQRLDLGRPPWELWMVEGLEGGRWAIICKVHHCMVDGVGAGDLITELFDLEPAPPARPHLGERAPVVSSASTLSLAMEGLCRGVVQPARWLARRLVRWPSPARALAGLGRLREIRDFADGLPRTARNIAHRGVPSLGGPRGPYRRWTWLETDLDQVKAIRVALGGTVNDVVLAAVTHGFRALLAERGVLTDQTLVRSLVPVSTRSDDERGNLGNRTSALFVVLPCGEPDPVLRLEILRTQMDEHKHTRQAAGADSLVRLAGSMPTMLSVSTRALMAAMTPMFQAVTTNVPGPQFPLYALGRKVVAMYPYVPIGAGAGISVGILSYLGRLYFGVTADSDATPDLETLVTGIGTGLAELSDRAGLPEADVVR